MKRKLRTGLLGAAILLAGGCAGPCYFDLQTGTAPGGGGVRIDKVLLVDRVDINETYRDYRIVVRTSPFRVQYAASASWSRTPDELVEDAVAGFLAKRSVFRKVETFDSGGEHDLELKIRIEAIEKRLVGRVWHARLALGMEVVDAESGTVLLSHSFDRQVPLEGNKIRLVPEKISMILREELLKVEAGLAKVGRDAGS
jgi:ABC-type uncharacterized transport system auxiliary subunit